ncbi:hypothetical protein HORIV_03330 [Vreelandella olivaria]|uniref:Glycosyltransferase subfamily 4-like N-terminal domain-containing protein n=1 Tax=Vreelandella olivaria TaxID=390919 RepID=A0ABN5WU15_9GAMM|nr:hypothetical protein HORIV_03330 [Halomonas olivaria]
MIRPRPRSAGNATGINRELQVQRFALPGYTDVQVGLVRPATLRRFWRQHRPDIIYVATQGPLGWAARQAARQLNIPPGSRLAHQLRPLL